jgi:hypothetical protein
MIQRHATDVSKNFKIVVDLVHSDEIDKGNKYATT